MQATYPCPSLFLKGLSRGPARAHATGLTVLRGDVTRIPLASASFDVATSFDVLQCVEADLAAVREMA
ncbi:MAG: methyltransferase domain-containing protein, partial [Planctomycetota bacterium]